MTPTHYVGSYIRRLRGNRTRDRNKQLGIPVDWPLLGLPFMQLQRLHGKSDAAFDIRYSVSFLFPSVMLKLPILGRFARTTKNTAKVMPYITRSTTIGDKELISHNGGGGAYTAWFDQSGAKGLNSSPPPLQLRPAFPPTPCGRRRWGALSLTSLLSYCCCCCCC